MHATLVSLVVDCRLQDLLVVADLDAAQECQLLDFRRHGVVTHSRDDDLMRANGDVQENVDDVLQGVVRESVRLRAELTEEAVMRLATGDARQAERIGA